MKIGPYILETIETGSFALDGGAMFGVVPKALWSATNPADALNRITMAARVLLIRGNGRTILVDTGNGDKFSQKFREIYRISGETTLLKALREHGVQPDEITDVILTHLHFDHAGGATVRTPGGVLPAFPRARYYLQEEQYVHAMHPTEKDRASYVAENFQSLGEHGVLQLLNGAQTLFPGLDLIPVSGHSPAQQLVKISDGRESVLYCADLVPLTTHTAIPYVMAYDLYPLKSMEEKKLILPQAYEEGWLLVLEHDPGTVAMTLESTPKGFSAGKKFTSLDPSEDVR